MVSFSALRLAELNLEVKRCIRWPRIVLVSRIPEYMKRGMNYAYLSKNKLKRKIFEEFCLYKTEMMLKIKNKTTNWMMCCSGVTDCCVSVLVHRAIYRFVEICSITWPIDTALPHQWTQHYLINGHSITRPIGTALPDQ